MNEKKLLKNYDPSLIDHQFDVVSWMTLFEFLLEPCFIREKTNCPFYPNVHLHYADIRFMDGQNPIDIDPLVLHDIQKYYKTHQDINFKDFKNLVYILIYQSELIFKMLLTKKNFDHYLTKLINLSSFFNEPMKTLYINKIKNFEEKYNNLINCEYENFEETKTAWNAFVHKQMQVYKDTLNTLDLSTLTKEDLVIHDKFKLLIGKMEEQYELCGNFRKCEEDLNEIKKL